MYTNYNQIPDQWFALATQRMNIVLRAASSPRDLAPSARRQLFEVDRDQPIFDIKTMDERIGDATSRRRFSMTLLGVFAGVAVLLAAVGIYGVVSYSVSQRRHEMGIRSALGAKSSDILRLVMGQGLRLTIAGVAIGLAGGFALTRVMESLLYKVSPTDPLTFAVTSLVLAGVALGACSVPARRATKVDPMIALRCD
jgi:ABC-type antimicrobial peptide transport system permease subunit